MKVKGQFHADNRDAPVHFCTFIENNAMVCVWASFKNWVVFGGMNIHDHALTNYVQESVIYLLHV